MFFNKKPKDEDEDKGLVEFPEVPEGHPLKNIMDMLKAKAQSEGFEVRELSEQEYREKCESEGLPTPPPQGGKPGRNQKNLDALSSTLSQLKQLKKLHDTYFRKDEPHQVGDMVQWKSGLMNHRIPQYGEPVVVMEVFDPPLMDKDDAGSPYFREPITIKIGLIDHKEGNFYMIGVDGARFEKFDG